MAWTSNDGRKDGTWRVIAGKPGLAHAGAVVADQRGNFVVAHFRWILSIWLLVNLAVLTCRLMPLVDVRVPRQSTGLSLYISRVPGGGGSMSVWQATICIAAGRRDRVPLAVHQRPYMANRRPNWVGKPGREDRHGRCARDRYSYRASCCCCGCSRAASVAEARIAR